MGSGLLRVYADDHFFGTATAREFPGQVALPATTVPVTVCSISELEDMVTITDTPVGRLLLDRADDARRSTYALREAFSGHTHASNAGWDSYPWRDAAAGKVPSETAGAVL